MSNARDPWDYIRGYTIAEAIPQIVWVAQPDGSPLYFNGRWYLYTGLSREQTLGVDWCTPLHPDDKVRSVAGWARTTDTGEPYEAEYRLRAADGSYRWFLGHAIPCHCDSGMIICWLGTCTDIDDQRRQSELLERLVRERTSELQRSNRQLEEFASVASHDLQEPLRKIQAFGDRLRAKCGALLGEQGNEYLDRILNSADRMRSLINDLLTISRVASGAAPFVAVDLAAVAREVVSDLEGLIRLTGGHVELGPLPTVQADPLQMRQLFQNLIGNGSEIPLS